MTIDSSLKVSPYLLLLVSISTLGPMQFGFHLAELNAPQDVITCQQRGATTVPWSSTVPRSIPFADCIPMTPAAFATISSIYTIGALIGALAAGPVSSRRGRMSAMRLTAVFFLAGSLVETVAPGMTMLALGRLLAGMGGGASTVVVPLYISEVAPPAGRGFFGTATQCGINVGILATQTLGFFLSHGAAWRWILAAGAAFAVAHTIGLGLAVESPAWLAGVGGDPNAARKTLQRIRGGGVNVDEEARAWGGDGSAPEGTSEAEGLLAGDDAAAATVAAKSDKQHLGFMEVARHPLYRPAIVAVVGIMFAQQFCGINSIIMYSVSLLADVLPISSSLMTIMISLVNLVSTIAFSPLPDRLGRKACLLLSIFGQGTSSLVLALSILFGMKTLSAMAVLLFVASFGAGLGPVPFILSSELVSAEAVGATQSWALGANYVATFIVAQFFPILNEAINRRLGGAGWVYFIFAAFALIFAGFVSWRVPETKGKIDADEVWGRARRID